MEIQQRAETSGANRDPDVVDLARINVRLNLEADRLAGTDDKFIRPEGKIGEVNPRGCAFRTKPPQHDAVATGWPEDYSLRKTIRPTIIA